MIRTKLLLFVLLAQALISCGGGGSSPTPSTESAGAKGDEHSENQGHAEEESGPIKLSADQIKQAGIGLARSGPNEIRESLPLYGVIAPNAERMREIPARYAGIIRSVEKRIGDSVQQGARLAVVIGAGCSVEAPTLMPLSRELSTEAHRRLEKGPNETVSSS